MAATEESTTIGNTYVDLQKMPEWKQELLQKRKSQTQHSKPAYAEHDELHGATTEPDASSHNLNPLDAQDSHAGQVDPNVDWPLASKSHQSASDPHKQPDHHYQLHQIPTSINTTSSSPAKSPISSMPSNETGTAAHTAAAHSTSPAARAYTANTKEPAHMPTSSAINATAENKTASPAQQHANGEAAVPSPNNGNASAEQQLHNHDHHLQSHSRHGNERNSAAAEQTLLVASASSSHSANPSSSSSLSPSINQTNRTTTVVVASNTFVKHSAVQPVHKVSQNTANKSTKFSERVIKTKPSSTPSDFRSTNDGKMVAIQEPTSAEQFSFDDSEELQYGPGIVSKLRCRYLSLALRQTTSKQRPSLDNLRRATSLNNLLNEEDDIESTPKLWEKKINGEHKARTPDEFVSSHFLKKPVEATNANARCRVQQRGNDSMKRARSVEALMRYDQNAWQRDQSKDKTVTSPTRMVASTSGIIETIPEVPSSHQKPPLHTNNHSTKQTAPVDTVTIEDKIVNARERGEAKPKRLTSFMDETERPPPDLVKHTLRMFEATANRRPNSATRVGNSYDVAAKVTTFQSIISNEKPAIIFPKPPLSPAKKPTVAPRSTAALNPSIITSRSNTAPTIQSSANNITANGQNKSAAAIKPSIIQNGNAAKPISSVDTTSRSPSPLTVRIDSAYRTNKLDSPLSPRLYSPFLSSPLSPISNAYRSNDIERSPDVLKTATTSNMDSPIMALSKKIENLSIESPILAPSPTFKPNHFSTDLTDESDAAHSHCNEDSADGMFALRRISKTALANISKAGTTTEFKFGPKSTKSYLPGGAFTNTTTSTPKKLQNDMEPAPQHSPTPRQIGIIRPQVKALVQTPTTDASTPTKAAFADSAAVVNGQSAKPDVTLTPNVLEKNLINREKCEESPATSKWVTPNSSPAFQKPWQKSTGDAPQNNSMVFNFINREEVPDYIENDGMVVRRKRELPKPGQSGFVLLCDLTLETSTDPDESWTLGPPSPCDVEFQNDNVIIEGKSCLRDRSRTGHTQKMNIQFNEILTSTFEYPSESSMLVEDMSDFSDGLQQQMAIGSAPLGSYTPMKVPTMNSTFELGVTRSTSPYDHSSETTTAAKNGDAAAESLQYLKPATDDQTVAWSEGTSVTDLLF